MKITINKNQITKKFLNPVSRLVDRCIIKVQPDNISTLVHNEDNTIMLYGNLDIDTNLKDKEEIKLNIPDTKKLLRIFNCINEENITLTVDSNSINYKSDDLSFKYFLLDDNILKSTAMNIDKINNFNFTNSFELTPNKLNEILKGSTFTTDSNKIYFFAKDDKMYGELTDKTISNIDSVTYLIADEYDGEEIKKIIPIDLEIFRMFSGLKMGTITVKINIDPPILMFTINNKDITLKYIISSLVK